MFIYFTKKLLLSLALTICCIALMLWMVTLFEAGEPVVDLSEGDSAKNLIVRHEVDSTSLRFAVATMVSVESTFSTYQDLVRKICKDIGRSHLFILRPSYAEVRHELENSEVDVAFVCTGTYVNSLAEKKIKLLVQPEFLDDNTYRCLVIVPKQSTSRTIEDLRGKVMAFTDPESNTGCITPTVAVADHGYDVQTFFGNVVFTGSHDRSIRAVARGVVDGAGVDSLVWESILREEPALKNRVRIIWESEPFGPPSVVIPHNLDKNLELSLLNAFIALDKSQEGRHMLTELGIKRFIKSREEDYQSAIEQFEKFKSLGVISWH